MELAQKIHLLAMVHASLVEDFPADLSETVEKEIMGSEVENPSLYRHLQSMHGWKAWSDADLTATDEKHKTTVEELEKKVEEAKESAGDMEVLEARLAVARFAAKSLSKEEALEAYDKVLSLPKLSSGKSIDALMETARVASFYGDTRKTQELVERVSKSCR
jgi:26S proteasome regulatory subunit N7